MRRESEGLNDILSQIEENNSRHIDLLAKKHDLEKQISIKEEAHADLLSKIQAIRQERLEKLQYIGNIYSALNPEVYEADYVSNQVAEQAKLVSDAYSYISELDHQLRMYQRGEEITFIEIEKIAAEIQETNQHLEVLRSDLQILKVSENLYQHQIRMDSGEKNIYDHIKAIVSQFIGPDNLQRISANLKLHEWDHAYAIISSLISSISTMQLRNEIDSELSGSILLVYLYAFAVFCENQIHMNPVDKSKSTSRKRRNTDTFEANISKLSELNRALNLSHPNYAEALSTKIIVTDDYRDIVVGDMLQLTM